ncbi:MAG: hypothetical protein RBR20_03830 [Desulfobacterales bacterium]|nr:hypothetical protein [Desulfobacteraceae bacterium]MDD3990824.1 hypothetical protein [Desulfobacteraceae bacterium]MDY0311233.1 hypothetical protein [Desulfobacterales bacterium]
MTRFSRIWKLYIIYTAVLVVVMTLAGFCLDAQVTRRLQAHLEDDALMEARLAATYLPVEGRAGDLEVFCRRYREATGWRVTILRSNGTVIADSDRSTLGLDNHGDRIEIARALREGHATAVRMSTTLATEMIYAAVRDPRSDLLVRIAMPVQRVKAVKNEVMKIASIFLYFAPLVCAVISFAVARVLVGRGRPEQRLK